MEQYSIIDTDINHNIMYPLVSGGALPEQYSLHSIIRFTVHLTSQNFDFHHFCQLGSISLEMVKISKLWSHHFLGKGKSTKSWGNYKRYFSFDWGWFTDECDPLNRYLYWNISNNNVVFCWMQFVVNTDH